MSRAGISVDIFCGAVFVATIVGFFSTGVVVYYCFCVYWRSIVCCISFIVVWGVGMAGGVLFVFVLWDRFFISSLASISSICLIRMASSLSSASCGWVFCDIFPPIIVNEVIGMFEVFYILFILASFPFFVGTA
jgi:hypothetical protein